MNDTNGEVPITPLRTLVLPELHAAQHRDGYVSDDAMQEIASKLRMTVNAIEGIATSYPEIRRTRSGRHLIRICNGTPCWLAGSADMMHQLEEILDISVGETTTDGLATLETIPCCFVCAQAPAVELDGQIRSGLSAEDIAEFVQKNR